MKNNFLENEFLEIEEKIKCDKIIEWRYAKENCSLIIKILIPMILFAILFLYIKLYICILPIVAFCIPFIIDFCKDYRIYRYHNKHINEYLS